MDLETAALIAKLVSDAVGSFDKVFRGFADFIKKKEPSADYIPPPDFQYVDSPQEGGLVARSRRTGQVYQRVTYQELCDRLGDDDRKHLESLSKAMRRYQDQWDAVFVERAVAAGRERARLDGQLEDIAADISKTIIMILDFVSSAGLHLDDHYLMSRNVAESYLGNELD